ncbi:nucleotidyltransferase domain-containing protein [Persephonella sp.]|uniref:nucleotidyltransferase domain-containing protein n=1 Tax=Persephonella sp. TaxID=2060922 RepID=UPI0025D2025E|nr:nucleotidyltransferase domain-containing protein [Persephonella sp.]
MKTKELKTIRLTEYELKAIKDTAKEIFGNKAKVWLFGSRVNPKLKGGDIDIYIEIPDTKDWLDKKIDYLVKLKQKIGDQKIDLVLKPYNCQEDICIEAKKTGVRLI